MLNYSLSAVCETYVDVTDKTTDTFLGSKLAKWMMDKNNHFLFLPSNEENLSYYTCLENVYEWLPAEAQNLNTDSLPC